MADNSSPAPYNFTGKAVSQVIEGNVHLQSSGNSDGNLTVDGTSTLTGAVTAPGTFNSGTVTAFGGGVATVPPAITSPGTVATGGTVSNTTGYDCQVYMSSTTGISKIVLPGVSNGTVSSTAGGTVPALQMADFYVANGQSIAVTYTGTLTWVWLAI